MKKILLGIAVFALVMMPAVALAQPNLGLNDFGSQTQLGTKSLTATIASIINVAMGLLGMVVVVLILAGGFLWMTAAGSEEKISKAKSLIFGGVIGLAIILSAYAVAQFVVTSLLNATA
ncbi:pilin [Patescibacteria group bacterium]|nr:pilin [Patescibacteria group bacterium]